MSTNFIPPVHNGARQAFYERIGLQNMTPLWEVLGALVPKAPNSPLQQRHANLHLHVVVSTGNDDPRWRDGLVTSAFDSDWSSLAGWRAYLCGAPPMVEAAALLVKRRGVPPEHVYADAFYASAI